MPNYALDNADIIREAIFRQQSFSRPGALLHRQHPYLVQFNNDQKYPIIVAILEESTA